MGKTQKPLIIVALPPCDTWEELDKLEAQGHTVVRVSAVDTGPHVVGTTDLADSLLNADIILGASCWRMDSQHKPYLALAIKEARALRYKYFEDRADTKKRRSAEKDIGLDGPSKDSGAEEV